MPNIFNSCSWAEICNFFIICDSWNEHRGSCLVYGDRYAYDGLVIVSSNIKTNSWKIFIWNDIVQGWTGTSVHFCCNLWNRPEIGANYSVDITMYTYSNFERKKHDTVERGLHFVVFLWILRHVHRWTWFVVNEYLNSFKKNYIYFYIYISRR